MTRACLALGRLGVGTLSVVPVSTATISTVVTIWQRVGRRGEVGKLISFLVVVIKIDIFQVGYW